MDIEGKCGWLIRGRGGGGGAKGMCWPPTKIIGVGDGTPPPPPSSYAYAIVFLYESYDCEKKKCYFTLTRKILLDLIVNIHPIISAG